MKATLSKLLLNRSYHQIQLSATTVSLCNDTARHVRHSHTQTHTHTHPHTHICVTSHSLWVRFGLYLFTDSDVTRNVQDIHGTDISLLDSAITASFPAVNVSAPVSITPVRRIVIIISYLLKQYKTQCKTQTGRKGLKWHSHYNRP